MIVPFFVVEQEQSKYAPMVAAEAIFCFIPFHSIAMNEIRNEDGRRITSFCEWKMK